MKQKIHSSRVLYFLTIKVDLHIGLMHNAGELRGDGKVVGDELEQLRIRFQTKKCKKQQQKTFSSSLFKILEPWSEIRKKCNKKNSHCTWSHCKCRRRLPSCEMIEGNRKKWRSKAERRAFSGIWACALSEKLIWDKKEKEISSQSHSDQSSSTRSQLHCLL